MSRGKFCTKPFTFRVKFMYNFSLSHIWQRKKYSKRTIIMPCRAASSCIFLSSTYTEAWTFFIVQYECSIKNIIKNTKYLSYLHSWQQVGYLPLKEQRQRCQNLSQCEMWVQAPAFTPWAGFTALSIPENWSQNSSKSDPDPIGAFSYVGYPPPPHCGRIMVAVVLVMVLVILDKKLTFVLDNIHGKLTKLLILGR